VNQEKRAPTQEERALRRCCRACQAGVGERCFDLRPGFDGLRKKHLCSTRVVDARQGARR
jgi:hypothetical protein